MSADSISVVPQSVSGNVDHVVKAAHDPVEAILINSCPVPGLIAAWKAFNSMSCGNVRHHCGWWSAYRAKAW